MEKRQQKRTESFHIPTEKETVRSLHQHKRIIQSYFVTAWLQD